MASYELEPVDLEHFAPAGANYYHALSILVRRTVTEVWAELHDPVPLAWCTGIRRAARRPVARDVAAIRRDAVARSGPMAHRKEGALR